jgi:4-diphosphocytidyl-2-C-methyl-D-erythritol kinase
MAGQRCASRRLSEPAVTAEAGPATRLAHAKLNVRLEVGDRAGSLHTLVSVIASLSLADELRFSEADAFSLRTSDESIAGRDNLVWRAAHAFDGFAPAVHIELDKRIPMQAGLGGGSADAAVTLEYAACLLEARQQPVSREALSEAAFHLGSDVPSALVSGLKIVAGCGDLVTPYPCRLPEWGIILLKPAQGSDTGRAYDLLDEAGKRHALGDGAVERARAMCEAIAAHDFSTFVRSVHNDFSEAVERAIPGVGSVRERLSAAGAAGTLLCGSGSCVAGFFASADAARAAIARIGVAPDEWCMHTSFHD